VREQHFDLLSLSPRRDIGVRGGDIARHVAGAFVEGTQDLASGRARTATWLQRTRVAIQLARTVSHEAFFIDAFSG
jgi:hypothetical protein